MADKIEYISQNQGDPMLSIFLNTLPFFALIGLGYFSGRIRFFSREATAHLTQFVFYFALSAMLFRFASNLSLGELLDWNYMGAYLLATLTLYVSAALFARFRGEPFETSVIEAQSSVIGNMGWMGLAMLPILLGPEAVGPVMLVLIVDLVFFGPLVVMLIVGHREGRVSLNLFRTLGLGLLKNPMVMSIVLGLAWAAMGWPVPLLLNRFMEILAGASTPGALFAIGASMAYVTAKTVKIPSVLSLNKLILHPLLVAIVSIGVFTLDPFASAVMIACAAMPVAGNVYMIANHYGIDTDRVSVAILISTAASVLTIPLIIQWSGV